MLSALFLATVSGISDGDTLTILNENKQRVKIRLAEIDAPEARQPFVRHSRFVHRPKTHCDEFFSNVEPKVPSI